MHVQAWSVLLQLGNGLMVPNGFWFPSEPAVNFVEEETAAHKTQSGFPPAVPVPVTQGRVSMR